ncbi:unnamed protein product [Ceutorhynchus assimilis]|uniref:Major facilitator superfamily (MFS) profile domain-containing protein n=1 Tax=Ceutorhynchus assimilis TaxID=467358 RepID=A0A9P0DG03_9CUCU|nr:unnamed protein product [Ceutorhynchus assimilis]
MEQEATTKLNPVESETSYDTIKATIGDFGRWQLKISLLMAMVKFPIAWFQMSIVFLAPPVEFWCQKLPGSENITDQEWKRLTLPSENQTSKQNGINQGFCVMKPTSNQSSLLSCPGYTYNESVFTSTITSEWDLVCDRQNLADFSQVSLMFGILLGNIIFGILADQRGRKKILLICLVLQSIFGIGASISPHFWMFVLLRFCLALANGGTMVTSFVICMEAVGGKWRTIVPILYQIPFGFGYSSLAGIAYFIRDWRDLHVAISVLSLPYVSFSWLVPESPRWLLAIGKHKEALRILKKAAKENNLKLFDIANEMTNLSKQGCTKQPKMSFKQLFSTKILIRRTYLLCINWSLAGISFYAFIQHIGHVSNNLFFTVAVGGFISLPGTIICVFLVSNYGRRMTISYSYLLTATCSLLILAFPKGVYVFDWPRVILAGIGIIGLSISIPAMYLFTGELYPTVMRNSGVGLAMMFSRLGSMIAPILVSLQNVASFLPLLIIGILSILQAVLIYPLPETQAYILPNTVGDLELLEKRKQPNFPKKTYQLKPKCNEEYFY